MKELLFLVPVVGLAGLLFAIFLKSYVIKQDPGNDKMREIADAIAEGARAFLASEYRILVIFVAVLFVVIGVGTHNWVTAVCFLTGSIFSTAAGYLGMSAARNQGTVNAAALSTDQLCNIRILLLRHNAASGAVRIIDLYETVFIGIPDNDLLTETA